MPKEIITLQLGNFANFVGTHWWNLQENALLADQSSENSDVDPNVFFTEQEFSSSIKQTAKSSQYIPRVICVDRKGSLSAVAKSSGFLRQRSSKTTSKTLINGDNESKLWPGQFQVSGTAEEFSPCNAFLADLYRVETTASLPERRILQQNLSEKVYNLDSVVSAWTDFLKPPLNQRSILLLGAAGDDEEVNSVPTDNAGPSQLSGAFADDGIEELIRYFSEPCDELQGFQILTTVGDCFSRLSVDVLSHIVDEFGRNKATMVFPTEHRSVEEQNKRLGPNSAIIHAMFVTRALEDAWMVCPATMAGTNVWTPNAEANSLKIPSINYDDNLAYHTSGIIASALDSATLPYQLQLHHPCRLPMANTLAFASKFLKINSLHTLLPFDRNLPDSAAWSCLSPRITIKSTDQPCFLTRCATLRSIGAVGRKNNFESRLLQRFPGLDSSSIIASVVDRPLVTRSPFPQHIFNAYSSDGKAVFSVGAAAAFLSSGRHTAGLLNGVLASVKSFSPGKHVTMLPEIEDWSQNLATLEDAADHAASLIGMMH